MDHHHPESEEAKLLAQIAARFGARVAKGTTISMLSGGPGEPTLAVFEHRRQRWLGSFSWGVSRHGAEYSAHDLQLHSRAETLRAWAQEGPTTHRRCILPMVAFRQRVTQPGHGGASIGTYATVKAADRRFLPIAAVWHEDTVSGRDPVRRTCTVVTVASNPAMDLIHHRMPAILKPVDWDLWLNPAERRAEPVLSLLQPWDGELELVMHERTPAKTPGPAADPRHPSLFDDL
jgi:putative SOS response-associated peptidase YedK